MFHRVMQHRHKRGEDHHDGQAAVGPQQEGVKQGAGWWSVYRTHTFIIHILFQDQKEQVTEVKKEEKISFNPVDQVIDDIKLIGENEEQEIAEVQEKDVEQEVAEVQEEDEEQEVAEVQEADVEQVVSEVQEEDVEQEVSEVQEEDVEQEVSEVQEEDVQQEEEQEQEQEVEDMAENVEIGRCRRTEGAENFLLVLFNAHSKAFKDNNFFNSISVQLEWLK